MSTTLTREETLRIIENRGTDATALLSILLDIQAQSPMSYVDEASATLVAQCLHLPLSKVYDALTYYSMLNQKPLARYVIEVCGSPPCYFNGSRVVVQLLQTILGLKMNESTPDGLFALRETTCVGGCENAPVMKIGDTVYGNLDESKIRAILDTLRAQNLS